MNSINNNQNINRNNRGILSLGGMLQGRNGMPLEIPWISIPGANRNIINVVPNLREDEFIIRNNFINDNDVVNHLNYNRGRNIAPVIEGTPGDPSTSDIARQNFPLQFNNTVNNIYSQLNSLLVDFSNYRESMERNQPIGAASCGGNQNINNNNNNNTNPPYHSNIMGNHSNMNNNKINKKENAFDKNNRNNRGKINGNNNINSQAIENSHNNNESVDKKMEVEGTNTYNNMDMNQGNVKNNIGNDKNMASKKSNEYPPQSYYTPENNEVNNNSSNAHGPSNDTLFGKMENTSNENNISEKKENYSNYKIDLGPQNIFPSENNINNEGEPLSETLINVNQCMQGKLLGCNTENSTPNKESDDVKINLPPITFEDQKKEDNKQYNNKQYNNIGETPIEPEIIHNNINVMLYEELQEKNITVNGKNEDATPKEKDKKDVNNRGIINNEVNKNSNNPENISKGEIESNYHEKNENNMKNNNKIIEDRPHPNNISNNSKDINKNDSNNIGNINQIKKYYISDQKYFYIINNNNNTKIDKEGPLNIDNNKLSYTFTPDNFQKKNLNSIDSFNSNRTSDNNFQIINNNSDYTPQRENFCFRCYNEDSANELFYYIKEKKKPHLVICTYKIIKNNKRVFFLFISFYTYKNIIKNYIQNMESLLGNRNYRNMYEFFFRSGDYYYNGYSDEGYNIEAVFKEYKRSGKLILIPKKNIITNSSNIISTTSSCSHSRANSTNTKENNNSGLKNKNNSRLSRESKIKKELTDSPVNNKNISPQTISLKESPESKKNNSESKIYKDKYYKARFSGEKVALEVKFWKKLHKNKRKKRYSIIHNENIEVSRSPKEYNKNKNIGNDSEEDTQINSHKDSPIKFIPSAQKELKFLNGKLKKDNNPELLELENNYLNPTKKRKEEDKSDNSNGKEHDKLNSSKFIEISSQYGESSEKKNNNMAIITLSDSDKDEEPVNQNNPKDGDADDNVGRKVIDKDGAANNRGDQSNKL
jgi:hypothetical protein